MMGLSTHLTYRISNYSLIGNLVSKMWVMNNLKTVYAWYLTIPSFCSQDSDVTSAINPMLSMINLSTCWASSAPDVSYACFSLSLTMISSMHLRPKAMAFTYFSLSFAFSFWVIMGCYWSLSSIGLFRFFIELLMKSHSLLNISFL